MESGGWSRRLSPAEAAAGGPVGGRTESLTGIALMAVGMFLFAGVDALAKLLTDTLHPVQIVWARQLGLLLGVVGLITVKGVTVLRTRRPVLQIVRGACAGISPVLYVTAVAFVPLADAVAVAFVAPFMVTVLGALVLREPVGVRRWVAVAVGFLGAMIVIRPGMGVVHPAVVLVLGAATLFAVRQIISRSLGQSERTTTTVAYTAIAGSLVLTLPLPFVWRWPSSGLEAWLLMAIAMMAGVGETLVIKALEVAQAVVLAPVQYTMLIWGTAYGYVLFGDVPDVWTFVGAAIIMATGLYTLNRERLALARLPD